MEEKKKLNWGDYTIDTSRMFYFMNPYRHRNGITIVIKENMKKLQQKNKGEK